MFVCREIEAGLRVLSVGAASREAQLWPEGFRSVRTLADVTAADQAARVHAESVARTATPA